MSTHAGKLSRNDPCPCGSGRKYKQCCIRNPAAALLDARRADPVVHAPKPRRDRHGIVIKTDEQIAGIRAASQLTRSVLDLVAERIAAGVTTLQIDEWVHQAITDAGGSSATRGYRGGGPTPFPASVCTSVNEVVCHGIPSADRVLRDGDIINVDVTSVLDGYYGDASRMFMIGDVADEARRLVEVARECMDVGIAAVWPGRDLADVGIAIEAHARAHGYSVVRDFGGHGVGLAMHEDPHIAHFKTRKTGILMRENMVFTVEPMINAGRHALEILDDGWTAVTRDGSLSAQWEHTVVVTREGADRLTA